MKRPQLAVLSYKKHVDACIRENLDQAIYRYRSLPWARDAFSRLAVFAVAGKSLRGSLAIFTYRIYHPDIPRDVLKTAAALELFHTAFLIHDDIMDRDLIRRKMPSIQSQYAHLASMKHGVDEAHFGLSQAINLGDLSIVSAYRLLSQIHQPEIIHYISEELTAVMLGQMQDVSGGHIPSRLTKEDIFSLYKYKTARYTFSLPFTVGAMLAKTDAKTISDLVKLGENFGLLFQIRDDELGCAGSVAVTGKPIGSDAANNKQTLAGMLSQNELHALKKELRTEALHIIRSLPIPPQRQQELTKLLTFCDTRKH